MTLILMKQTPEILRENSIVAEGPAAAVILQPLLIKLAGEGADLASLTLDFSAPLRVGESVMAEAWIERATRSLVFAHGRICRPSGELAASGSAVFRRAAPALVPQDRQA